MEIKNNPLYILKTIKNIIDWKGYEFNTENFNDNYKSEIISSNEVITQLRIGFYFKLNFNSDENYYPWIGVYYEDEGSSIWLEFSKERCEQIYNAIYKKIKNYKLKINENNVFCYPELDDSNNVIRFKLNENYLREISKYLVYNVQTGSIYSNLNKFFKEVINFVKNELNK
ncbi:MAG TPA: hypothetical protein PK995_02820 [Bacteroidia bacterium]|nr:hypothetical protein [Bacteroidia bacterium]